MENGPNPNQTLMFVHADQLPAQPGYFYISTLHVGGFSLTAKRPLLGLTSKCMRESLEAPPPRLATDRVALGRMETLASDL